MDIHFLDGNNSLSVQILSSLWQVIFSFMLSESCITLFLILIWLQNCKIQVFIWQEMSSKPIRGHKFVQLGFYCLTLWPSLNLRDSNIGSYYSEYWADIFDLTNHVRLLNKDHLATPPKESQAKPTLNKQQKYQPYLI